MKQEWDSQLRIMFVGAPGSGKSTVGREVARVCGVPFIEFGSLLRSQPPSWLQKHDYPRLPSATIPVSELVPIVEGALSGHTDWVMEGFPRTEVQARTLRNRGFRFSRVFVMQVSDGVRLNRLLARPVRRGEDQRGRDCQALMDRISRYNAEVGGIVEVFSDVSEEIDGERPVPEVALDAVGRVLRMLRARNVENTFPTFQ